MTYEVKTRLYRNEGKRYLELATQDALRKAKERLFNDLEGLFTTEILDNPDGSVTVIMSINTYKAD